MIRAYIKGGWREKVLDGTVIDGNKKIQRKMKLVKGTTNFYKFQYNNKIYYAVRFSLDESDVRVFELNEDFNQEINWNDIPVLLNKLIEKYEYIQTDDSSVPAGPDTSKFIATKRGVLSVEKNYWTTSYYSRIGYKYIFKIGTGIKSNKDQLINDLLTIYMNAEKSELTLNNRPIRIGIVCGSAWTGYGIC